MNTFDRLILEGILGGSGENPYEPINHRGYYRWNGPSLYKEYVWYGLGQSLVKKLHELKRQLSIQLDEEKKCFDNGETVHVRSGLIEAKIIKLESQIENYVTLGSDANGRKRA